ncbi:zinc finger protein ZFP2-like isoform X2 [Artemia franciscana]|uniref:zinc finger protein ZFP2-like isoform X2 n=1 Tax=Artemia franciscana TaxID=6661 RepID=UPI0032DA43DA
MAEEDTLLEASNIKNGVEDVLASEVSDQIDIPESLFFHKLTDFTGVAFPGILAPCKVELDSQEFVSLSVDNEEVEEAFPSDIKKQVDSSDPSMFAQLEEGPMSIFPSILLPCKLEPDCQELGSTSITHQEVMNSTICSIGGDHQRKLWRCNSCGKTEKSFLILELHIDTGCEELSPIECDICPAVVRDYKDFVAHFMEHQMGEERRCPICLQDNIDNIKEHLILQGHFSQSVAELALQSGTSQATVQESSRNVSLNSFNLNSKIAGQTNKGYLLNRRLPEKKFRHHECSICKKKFPNKCNLKMHQRTHKRVKSFECDICKNSFSELWILNRHKRKHTGERPFQCNICKKTFAELGNLTKHKRVHTGEKPFQCDICKKAFAESTDLTKHKRVHTGEKPFQCDVCKKTFAESGNLIGHKRVHTGEKPFQCDICNKAFAQSGTLIIHKRVHTGKKPFQCDICKKCFTQSAALTVHKRVHTGEKPFHCDICKKNFAESGHLIRHKRIHTGEKPFQCDICKKTFAQSGPLKKHQRVHIPEKSFSCDICKKAFANLAHLTTHKRVHTSEKCF